MKKIPKGLRVIIASWIGVIIIIALIIWKGRNVDNILDHKATTTDSTLYFHQQIDSALQNCNAADSIPEK
jgi:hypothetical protein